MNTVICRTVTAAYFTVFMAVAYAQSAVLTGQVSSAEEAAMEGVVVSAKKDGSTISISVVTDARGRFAFPAARLEPGHYTLKARAAGYELAAAAPAVQAQQSDLDETQRLGRQVFAQSCGICHLQPSMGVKTYGPPLNKASAGGNDEVMRVFIVNGSERMPAFKYYLKPGEIDAIIAYLRTVPGESR